MELEEIIKPYSLAPESTKRSHPEGTQANWGAAKRQQTDGGPAAGDVSSSGGPAKKVFLEELPDEIDASAVEKILEQADEVRIAVLSFSCA